MVYDKDLSLPIKNLHNHEYRGHTNQWKLGKPKSESNISHHKHLVYQRDRTDIIKWILSPCLGSIKHHHTKQQRNQMLLEVSFIIENITIPILKPIIKPTKMKIVEDNV